MADECSPVHYESRSALIDLLTTTSGSESDSSSGSDEEDEEEEDVAHQKRNVGTKGMFARYEKTGRMR